MEWDKIEKNWKKQLNEREIAPSGDAWNKLAQQLDQQEQKVKVIAYKKWLAIAACLVLGGMISWMLLLLSSITNDGVIIPEINEQMVVEIEDSIESKTKSTNDTLLITEKPSKAIVNSNKTESKKDNYQQIISNNKLLEDKKEENIAQNEVINQTHPTKLLPIIVPVKAPNKIVVDSNSILQQVEGEVELEYRDTKLKKIYDSTKKVIVDMSNSKYEK